MPDFTRRALIGGAAAFAGSILHAQNARKLKVRTSQEIAASPISMGFETLDRMIFQPERTYEWIGKTGVKWARCQTSWGRTEKKRGEYDFAWLDGIVNNLLELGIQPWFNVGYGNQLYTGCASLLRGGLGSPFTMRARSKAGSAMWVPLPIASTTV